MPWKSRSHYTKYPKLSSTTIGDCYFPMEILNGNVLVGTLDGTATNIVSLASDGKVGNALYVNGVDQCVDLGNQRHTCLGSLHLCTEGITVALWFKVGDSTVNSIYLLSTGGETSESHGLSIYYHENTESIRSRFRKLDAPTVDTAIFTSPLIYAVPRHEWHHVITTWQPNGDAVLYVDGVERYTLAGAPDAATHNPTYNTVRIGCKNRDDTPRYYTGYIDELIVFYTVKDAAQASSMYANYN